MKSKTFQDVEVWRKAQDWVLKSMPFQDGSLSMKDLDLSIATCGCFSTRKLCGGIQETRLG